MPARISCARAAHEAWKKVDPPGRIVVGGQAGIGGVRASAISVRSPGLHQVGM